MEGMNEGGSGGATELGPAGGVGGDGEDRIVQALGVQPKLSVISHDGVEIFSNTECEIKLWPSATADGS